jgi:hypothetical protein
MNDKAFQLDARTKQGSHLTADKRTDEDLSD